MINNLFYSSMSSVLSQWGDFKVSRNLYKAYFNMQKGEKTSKSGSNDKTQSAANKVNYKNTTEDKLGKLSEEVSKSVSNLESAFAKDKKTGEIDREKAYSAAEKFVGSYNDLVSATRKSGDKTVFGKHEFISNMTNAYSRKLQNVGITVGSDGQMSIDKEKFNNASEADLDKIFGKKNSFAEFMKGQSNQLSHYSTIEKYQKQTTGTYNKTGAKQVNALTSGELLNLLK